MTIDLRPKAPEPRYRLAAGRSVWRSVGSEGVVLDLQHSVYFRVNRTGQALWSMLDKGCTAADLVESLMADVSVQRDQAEQEVSAFLAAVDSQGLFEDSRDHE